MFDSNTGKLLYRHINMKDVLLEMYKSLMRPEGISHPKMVEVIEFTPAAS
jgi:hypothetical protein